VLLHVVRQEKLRRDLETRGQLEKNIELAWAGKCKSLEHAQDHAENALRLQTKRWENTRKELDQELDVLRKKLAQSSSDSRDAQVHLQHMTLQRDEWKNQCVMIKVTLRGVEAKCNRLVNRVSELEQDNMAQHSALQEATEKLHVALEDKDAVKRDYSALVEASEAKDTLRAKFEEVHEEVHQREAANAHAVSQELMQERRDREKECSGLRMELFSLRQASAERNDRQVELRLMDRVAELEQSNAVQYSALQEATNELHVAREEADAVRRDHSALDDASDAKNNALRSELAEVHRRAAANDRAAEDALTREQRAREKECSGLRREIFSLGQASAEREDRLHVAEQLWECNREKAESIILVLETELSASQARELEASERADKIMKDFGEEASTLRSKVMELTHAVREAEDTLFDIEQKGKALESQMQQEQRDLQSKYMDLQRQLQTAEEEVQVQSQMVSAATNQTLSVTQQLTQMNVELKDFVQELQEELHCRMQLQMEVYSFKAEVSKRDDMLVQTSTALAEQTRQAMQVMANHTLEMASKDDLLEHKEDAMQSSHNQVAILCLVYTFWLHMLNDNLKDSQAKLNRLMDRVAELEQSNAVQYSALQEATNELHVAREEADAVRRDHSALDDASDAKNNALRSELAEVHRRAAANDRAAEDALTREQRAREKECSGLRREIFSLGQASAEREDRLHVAEQLWECNREKAESIILVLETELSASQARELEASERADKIMKDFGEEASTLRSKVMELTHAVREAEDTLFDIEQKGKALESQMQQEQRDLQSKCRDLQRQAQTAEEQVKVLHRRAFTATNKVQFVMQVELRQMHFDLKQFEADLQEEKCQKQLYQDVSTLKAEVSRWDDMLLHTSTKFPTFEMGSTLKQTTTRDIDEDLEGFVRGVEACQAASNLLRDEVSGLCRKYIIRNYAAMQKVIHKAIVRFKFCRPCMHIMLCIALALLT
jgi:hypothetical protein